MLWAWPGTESVDMAIVAEATCSLRSWGLLLGEGSMESGQEGLPQLAQQLAVGPGQLPSLRSTSLTNRRQREAGHGGLQAPESRRVCPPDTRPFCTSLHSLFSFILTSL